MRYSLLTILLILCKLLFLQLFAKTVDVVTIVFWDHIKTDWSQFQHAWQMLAGYHTVDGFHGLVVIITLTTFKQY